MTGERLKGVREWVEKHKIESVAGLFVGGLVILGFSIGTINAAIALL